MKRAETIEALKTNEEVLRGRFGVKSLALFGSVARDEARRSSDVDVLVDFDRPVSLFDLAALREHLEDVLGASEVDLTLRDSIYPALRERILGEAVYVYGEEMEVSH